MLHHKAQVNVMDFFLAMSVAIIIIITITTTFIHYENRINRISSYNILLAKAYQISDILVKYPGNPGNWNPGNAEVIGLADEDRKISQDKLDQFVNMSQSNVKNIFKTNYNYYFLLKDKDGNEIVSSGAIGSLKKSATITRYVYYQNEEAIMEFTLWE